ncbi:hypothetical protein BaRGS_00027493 [Batillaria attramentaria]|uniref:C2H2-type domain-containing protein n=1 Tax=Batillaria attramentaria TaxID=370345 RepID=A0ABD0K261_9CAEN
MLVSAGRRTSTARHSQFPGSRIYACKTCGKVFLHQCNLIRHRKKCEGDFYLGCPMCSQRFYRRDRLQEHLASKHQAVDTMKGRKKRYRYQEPPQ